MTPIASAFAQRWLTSWIACRRLLAKVIAFSFVWLG
jgi:hypothetical protein